VVTFLALDSTGAVLIGTAGGLAKAFDGKWTVYTKANGTIPHYTVTGGVVDPEGGLWLVGDDMFVTSLQRSLTYTSSFLWGKYISVKSIQVGRSGVLWLGSYGGGLVRMENALH